ncbi:MAG: TIR domain-containing protein [Lachnospiraceae bacterium]|nr:TIR domain-containing protein [Lachnospiraceae bacterium]
MSTFFKPYEGDRPFAFISYAHLQSAEVVDTIRILHSKGWRLWYDEGIPAGSDWPANIARHMEACDSVIFFLSGRALDSPNCYSEIRTACRLGKDLLIVRLENCAPDERWQDMLNGRMEIPLQDSPEARAAAILQSGFLSRRFHYRRTENIPRHLAGLGASLLFFLSSAAALAALVTGKWNPFPTAVQEASVPETTVPEPEPEQAPPAVVDIGEAERYFAIQFPDRLQESAIRRVLAGAEGEILRGDLSEIETLYFCGSLSPDSLEQVQFDADGTCRVNGAPVLTGPVSDIGVLTYAVRLRELALICEPVEDLSPLAGHVLLNRLSLSGSSVKELSALRDLPSLETVNLEYTQVLDLTPLEALPGLKTVTVSRDMLPLNFSVNAPFEVILVRGN